MKILNAPDVSDRYCRTFSFTASVKLPRPRRQDKSDVSDKCHKALLNLAVRLSLRVLGADYVQLTGIRLPFEYKLFEEEGARPWRVEANVTCPLMYNLLTLQGDVVAEWKASSIAGDHFFISHRRFNFADTQVRDSVHRASSAHNSKLDAFSPLHPTTRRSRSAVKLA